MAESTPIRVLVADDHPIFRMGLIRLLETEPDITVVAEARDGREALELARELRPDVLLLDIAMPHCSGMEVLEDLRNRGPSLCTVVLSAALAPSDTVQALRLGAAGVMDKTASSDTLATCVRSVMTGRCWVGRDALELLVTAHADAPPPSREAQRRPFGLTGRELEVVAHVATGESNRDIAADLGLSEDTVKHHLSKIFDKTGQSSRVELALFAMRAGLVPNP
jgi:DNA-binding NarL/FixJ family response regulator